MNRSLRFLAALGAVAATLYGCGARSSLETGRTHTTATSSAGTGGQGIGGAGGAGGAGGQGGVGGEGGQGGAPLCLAGESRPCGTDVGACEFGKSACLEGTWGPCVGAVDPVPEACNGVDDDCNGQVDEGFNLGAACDGPDSDLCVDDVVTCNGCSPGPNNVETCNGKDDNCNGTIDSDCDTGDCKPALLVTGSTPSSPNCIDFPVEKGATGVIQYPCAGGMVTAQLGSLSFSGNVKNGIVLLSAVGSYKGPDGCTWQTNHSISGNLPDGSLKYAYSEMPIMGTGCWMPCTESGVVQVTW